MDEKAIILEHFPPGARRTARDHYADGWGMRAESLAYARWGTPFSDQMREAQQLVISRFPGEIFARGWIYERNSHRIVACAPS